MPENKTENEIIKENIDEILELFYGVTKKSKENGINNTTSGDN